MTQKPIGFHLSRLQYAFKGRRALPRLVRSYLRYKFRPDQVNLRCLSLLLGYKCPCKCPFCSVQELKRRYDDELSVEEFKDLIDQGMALGVVNSTLSGGEPLMYMDKLIPLIEHIRRRRGLCTIATTGIYLEERLDDLVEAGLNNVFISMGGIGQEHDQSRGVDGLFEHALGGLLKARERGLFVGVRGIVTHENLHDGSLEKLLAFLAGHRLLLTATPIYSGTTGRDGTTTVNVLPPEDQELARRFQAKHGNLMLDVNANFNYPACPAVYEWITILADGEAVPCAGIMTSLGNIREMPLKDILARGRMAPDLNRQSEVCRSGEDASFCARWIQPIEDAPKPVRLEEHPVLGPEMERIEGEEKNQ